jgi:hypothetical protein
VQEQRLLLSDPAALNYVLLSNAYDFPKPDEVRGELALILGKGVLFAEGDDHRRQRRIMQPAFSPAHIRELVPQFFERTHKVRFPSLIYSHSSRSQSRHPSRHLFGRHRQLHFLPLPLLFHSFCHQSPTLSSSAALHWTDSFLPQLRDLWNDLIDSDASGDATAWKDADAAQAYKAVKPEGESVIELTQWLNRLTLDIIGLCGFGYAFESLEGKKENRLGQAFTTMFSGSGGRKPTVPGVLVGRLAGMLIRALPVFKLADYIPLKRLRAIRAGFRTLEEESLKIIESKQGAVEKDGMDSIRGSKDLIALLRTCSSLLSYLSPFAQILLPVQSRQLRVTASRRCRRTSFVDSLRCVVSLPSLLLPPR